jgi:prepilin-type N-terminal cleavage/methylation domain-containing protein
MKKAFTLAEMLIVVAILGILAAIVLPTFRGHITEAKESAAKDTLRVLRNAIELYAAQHNGVPPGYQRGNMSMPLFNPFVMQLVATVTNASGISGGRIRTPEYPFGPYLSALPENPFNGLKYVRIIGNQEEFPDEATGAAGWIYKPLTKTIRLDWPGADKDGVRYFDY